MKSESEMRCSYISILSLFSLHMEYESPISISVKNLFLTFLSKKKSIPDLPFHVNNETAMLSNFSWSLAIFFALFI